MKLRVLCLIERVLPGELECCTLNNIQKRLDLFLESSHSLDFDPSRLKHFALLPEACEIFIDINGSLQLAGFLFGVY